MKKMMVIHFDKMSVRVPITGGETIEDVEDRLIEAVDSIGDNVAMSYKIELEEYDESEGR